MITALTTILTLLTVFTLCLALALGNVINRCKRYEELLKSITSNQLNIALTLAKLTQGQEDLANEVADAMPHFVRKGEVN